MSIQINHPPGTHSPVPARVRRDTVPDTDSTGISPTVIGEIIALAKAHGLRRVVLFGSRARGDYRPKSDIDLAVSGGSIDRFRLAVNDETGTLLSVDVVNLDPCAQPGLLAAIQKEGIVLYEKV